MGNENGLPGVGSGNTLWNASEVTEGTPGMGHPGVGTEFSFTCRFEFTKTSSRISILANGNIESYAPWEHLPNPNELHAYFYMYDSREKVVVSQLQIEICSTTMSSTTTSITTSITTTISTTTTPFDCNVALDNAERAWSQEKKTWCCLSTMGARGCTTSTTQTTTTLNAQCTTKSPKKPQAWCEKRCNNSKKCHRSCPKICTSGCACVGNEGPRRMQADILV